MEGGRERRKEAREGGREGGREFALTAESVFKCATSKFLPLLQQLSSVTSVSLHGYQITPVQLDAIVSALPRLMDLKVQLRFKSESDVMAALQCTCRLQSLVVSCRIPVSMNGFIDPALIIRVWSSRASYNPPDLGIQLLAATNCCGEWCDLDIPLHLPSTKHEARLLLYNVPLAFTNLSNCLVTQVEFRPSQPPVMPCFRLPSTELPDDTRVGLFVRQWNGFL